MIRTLVIGFCLALGMVLVLPWLIFWTVLTDNPALMYQAGMLAYRAASHMAGVQVRAEGREHIPPGACVFAANHASYLDPIVLFPVIPRRAAALVKKEIFRIPFLGVALRLAKFVPVDRARRTASASSIEAGVRNLRDGLSLVAFPEGTRSPDGRLLPFKKASFAMAIECGVPVVPVSLAGTHHLMRRGSWSVHPGEVTIRFGAPVDASQYTLARRADLAARVQSLVAAGLPPDQQPAPPDA